MSALKNMRDWYGRYGPMTLLVAGRRLHIAAEEMAALMRFLLIDLRVSKETIGRYEAEALMGNYKPPDILILLAHDCLLFDEDGRCYADFQSGYSANNAGNCNPRITGANHLASSLTSIMSRARRNRQLPLAAHELQSVLGLDYKFLPMNSGCEAIEGATLLAKLVFNRHERFREKREALTKAGRVPKIVVCANNFHGRSSWAKAVSTNPAYRDPFAPHTLEDEVVKVKFGDVDGLELAFSRGDISAFVVEPIQCEGGMNVPPSGYFLEVKRLCDKYGVLLVADEVQTGLGRTGSLLALDQFFNGKTEADIIALAKSISGGQEVVSGILARPEYADLIRPSEHGSTFGGGPKAALTMRAALRELKERDLCRRAEVNGAICLELLQQICCEVPGVIEVRGLGLAIGIEMKGHLADEVCARMRQCPFVFRGRKFDGCWTNSTHGITDETTVIRVSPPLTMPTDMLTAAMYSFAQALGHPEPKVFRRRDLAKPYTRGERAAKTWELVEYLFRRWHRFRKDLADLK